MNVRRVFRSHPRMVRFDAGSSSRQLRVFFFFGVRDQIDNCFVISGQDQIDNCFVIYGQDQIDNFSFIYGRHQSVTLSYSVSVSLAMSAYVCLGRFYIQNMRARARASQPKHDGEERQRRRHVTMGCPLLLTERWIEKLRPARGAVRVTQDPPQTPAEKLKDASLRLRFDSDLNHIDSRRGGREAQHLPDCSSHLTSTVRFSK